MTQIQHRLIQTFKIFIFIISAFIYLGGTYNSSAVNATEFGEIEYNNKFIDYSKIDKTLTRERADYYFNKALEEKDKNLKRDYLKTASGEYFILTQAEHNNLYPIVQLARVYDMENENSYAKAYFFQALKIDKNNTSTNYYFGEYYFTRRDYTRALYFYNIAFKNGLQENFDILLKMGIMYEKLGDLLRANQYYKKAYLVKPENVEVPNKIREIESLRYRNSGYYNMRKRK